MKKLFISILFIFCGIYSLYSQVANLTSIFATLAYPNTTTPEIAAEILIDHTTYCWQKSTNGSQYSDIPNSTGGSERYTGYYDNNTINVTTYYRLKINTVNIGTVTSDPVVITIIPNFNVGTITASKSICYNTNPGTISFTTIPSGGTGAYTYQWQSANVGGSFSNISGAKGTSISVGNLTSSKQYRCIVTGGVGDTYTETCVITVPNPANFDQGTIGSNQAICYNATPNSFTVISNPTNGISPYTYKWKLSTGGSYSDIQGATSTTYSPGSLTKTTSYIREVKDACGTIDDGTDKVITIKVQLPVTGGAIADNQTVCYNSKPNSITNHTNAGGGDGSNYSYFWQSSTNNSSWTNISGATSQSYSPNEMTSNLYYRRGVKSVECGPAYSSSVLVNVRKEFTAGSIGDNQVICANSSPNAITFKTAPSTEGAVSYQWQESSNNSSFTDIPSAVSGSYSPGKLSANKYYKCKIGTVCGDLYSNTISVKMPSELLAGAISGSGTICYNKKPNSLQSTTNASQGKAPLTYQWQWTTDKNKWNNIIDEGQNSTYQPEKLIDTTYFRRVVKDACNVQKNSNELAINVRSNVVPVINKKNGYCKGDTVIVNINNPYKTNNWYSENWTLLTDNDSLVIGLIKKPHLYYLVSIDDNNCASDTIELPITPDSVKADFIVNTYEIEAGELQKFINRSEDAQFYIWILKEGVESYEKSASYRYNEPGWYNITLIASSSNSCTDTITKVNAFKVLSGTGIAEKYSKEVKIHPQPAGDILNIELGAYSEAILTVYSLSGEKINEYKIHDSISSVDVSALNRGAYVVNINLGQGKEFSRVLLKK